MIREALEYLFTAGRQSADVIVKPEAEPPHVYYVREPNGKLTKWYADPPPKSHTALSMATLVDTAKGLVGPCNPSVWYSAESVVATLDRDRRDRITLPLDLSEPFKLLRQWHANKPAISQADLIRALRITLADCLASSGNLLDIIRRVRFRTGSDTTAEVSHGRSSIGKALESEVTGTGILPEYVGFSVPVFATPCVAGIRAHVRCALDPDAATGTFRVIPIPGQLESAAEDAVEEIGMTVRDLVGEAAVGVYHGKP